MGPQATDGRVEHPFAGPQAARQHVLVRVVTAQRHAEHRAVEVLMRRNGLVAGLDHCTKTLFGRRLALKRCADAVLFYLSRGVKRSVRNQCFDGGEVAVGGRAAHLGAICNFCDGEALAFAHKLCGAFD